MENDEASPKVDKRGTTILVPIGLVSLRRYGSASDLAQRPGCADTGPWQWDGTARCSEVADTGRFSASPEIRQCGCEGVVVAEAAIVTVRRAIGS